jgi:hypothetical protein
MAFEKKNRLFMGHGEKAGSSAAVQHRATMSGFIPCCLWF